MDKQEAVRQEDAFNRVRDYRQHKRTGVAAGILSKAILSSRPGCVCWAARSKRLTRGLVQGGYCTPDPPTRTLFKTPPYEALQECFYCRWTGRIRGLCGGAAPRGVLSCQHYQYRQKPIHHGEYVALVEWVGLELHGAWSRHLSTIMLPFNLCGSCARCGVTNGLGTLCRKDAVRYCVSTVLQGRTFGGVAGKFLLLKILYLRIASVAVV